MEKEFSTVWLLCSGQLFWHWQLRHWDSNCAIILGQLAIYCTLSCNWHFNCPFLGTIVWDRVSETTRREGMASRPELHSSQTKSSLWDQQDLSTPAMATESQSHWGRCQNWIGV